MRLRLLVTLSLLLTVAACSTGSGPATTPAPTGASTPEETLSTTGTPTTGDSELTIVVDDGAGTTTTWTLTCDPPGGNHPDPGQACTTVEEHRSALDPVPKDRMCAQVYGGPEKATITGSWRGQPVRASLSRVNSCETARWDALVPVLPAGGR